MTNVFYSECHANKSAGPTSILFTYTNLRKASVQKFYSREAIVVLGKPSQEGMIETTCSYRIQYRCYRLLDQIRKKARIILFVCFFLYHFTLKERERSTGTIETHIQHAFRGFLSCYPWTLNTYLFFRLVFICIMYIFFLCSTIEMMWPLSSFKALGMWRPSYAQACVTEVFSKSDLLSKHSVQQPDL